MKKDRLILFCNAIGFITALLALLQFLFIAELLYELGKDSSKTFVWEVLIHGLQGWGIVFCCIAFFILARHAKKNEVYTPKNESLLSVFGIIIAGFGMLSNMLIHVFDIQTISTSTCNLLILMGLIFVFFSLILKIGRQIKEEQDLTI